MDALHVFYKQIGPGYSLKAAYIFKVSGAQNCLLVT